MQLCRPDPIYSNGSVSNAVFNCLNRNLDIRISIDAVRIQPCGFGSRFVDVVKPLIELTRIKGLNYEAHRHLRTLWGIT
jgi:hypothetical protein